MSFNTLLDNRTPFAAKLLVLPDNDGQEVSLIVVSATFVAQPERLIRVDEIQEEIRTTDQPRDPDRPSSTLREADVAIEKPLVDVLVIGQAYAPAGEYADRVQVRLSVGDIDKTLVVIGDTTADGIVRPFRTMPIIYERAFGGTTASGAVEMRNPIGVGYQNQRSSAPDVLTARPNVTTVSSDRLEPAGLGPIGRWWHPRARFAGTYDQRWLDSRWPLLPEDFDARYYQSAPPDQQSRSVRGGERVEIVNMTPAGYWQFALPRVNVPIHLLYADRYERSHLTVDTIVFQPDAYRVVLTGRHAVPTVRNAGALKRVVLGHVTNAWIRAVARRKTYIDYRGTGGTNGMQPCFYAQ